MQRAETKNLSMPPILFATSIFVSKGIPHCEATIPAIVQFVPIGDSILVKLVAFFSRLFRCGVKPGKRELSVYVFSNCSRYKNIIFLDFLINFISLLS